MATIFDRALQQRMAAAGEGNPPAPAASAPPAMTQSQFAGPPISPEQKALQMQQLAKILQMRQMQERMQQQQMQAPMMPGP